MQRLHLASLIIWPKRMSATTYTLLKSLTRKHTPSLLKTPSMPKSSQPSYSLSTSLWLMPGMVSAWSRRRTELFAYFKIRLKTQWTPTESILPSGKPLLLLVQLLEAPTSLLFRTWTLTQAPTKIPPSPMFRPGSTHSIAQVELLHQKLTSALGGSQTGWEVSHRATRDSA